MDMNLDSVFGSPREEPDPQQMSTLTRHDKSRLEKLFRMWDGYVLNFSDRTFAQFFAEEADIQIYENGRYSWRASCSKANLLRAFWHVESDRTVAKVLDRLIDRVVEKGRSEGDNLVVECRRIVRRLRGDNAGLDDLMEIGTLQSLSQVESAVHRIREAVSKDPALAIGSAKDLVETVCKTILGESAIGRSEVRKFHSLLRATLKELDLIPEGVPESRRGKKVIQGILGSLGTVGNGVAELRNLYGTGHGRHGAAGGLQERHAKLAVGAMATLAVFLFETHAARRADRVGRHDA